MKENNEEILDNLLSSLLEKECINSVKNEIIHFFDTFGGIELYTKNFIITKKEIFKHNKGYNISIFFFDYENDVLQSQIIDEQYYNKILNVFYNRHLS